MCILYCNIYIYTHLYLKNWYPVTCDLGVLGSWSAEIAWCCLKHHGQLEEHWQIGDMLRKNWISKFCQGTPRRLGVPQVNNAKRWWGYMLSAQAVAWKNGGAERWLCLVSYCAQLFLKLLQVHCWVDKGDHRRYPALLQRCLMFHSFSHVYFMHYFTAIQDTNGLTLKHFQAYLFIDLLKNMNLKWLDPLVMGAQHMNYTDADGSAVAADTF